MAGGANAARADLARLKQGTADPAKIAAATHVFRAGDSLLNAMRTYEMEHPTLERYVDALMEKAVAFWEPYNDLVVKLDARTLNMSGESVYAVERVEDNCWFPLYGCGVRQLSLTPNATRDEMRSLFRIVNKFKAGAEEGFDEDDPVTLLWAAGLVGVQYVAVDSYSAIGGDSEYASESGKELEQLESLSMMQELTSASLCGQSYAGGELARRIHTVTLNKSDLAFLRDEGLADLDDIPIANKQREDLVAIDGADRERYVHKFSNDPDLVSRYVEGILFASEGHGKATTKQELLGLLVERCAEAIKTSEFILAAKIIGRLQSMPELVKRAITTETSQAVTTAFAGNNTPEESAAIAELLTHCAGDAATVLKIASAIEDVRKRGELLRTSERWGKETALAAATLIATCNSAFAQELVDVLARIPDPSARQALHAATEHENYRVRVAAYSHVLSARDEYGRAAARRALNDEHSLVRMAALDYFVSFRPRDCKQWIMDRINFAGFDDLELVEKRRLYRALSAVAGEEIVPWMMNKLGQRNLTRRLATDHERIAAAAALAWLRAKSAKEELEKMLNSRFARQEVRQAAKDALEQLEKPPEPLGRVNTAPPRELFEAAKRAAKESGHE